MGQRKRLIEYDEEFVIQKATNYLEEKYSGNYEFRSCSGRVDTNWVNVIFKDLDKLDEKGTTFVTAEWHEDRR